jgi:hypothetical protein
MQYRLAAFINFYEKPWAVIALRKRKMQSRGMSIWNPKACPAQMPSAGVAGNAADETDL